MDEATKPGLSVEECVRRLKRYHYAFKRLHQIFTARITAEPIYELKMGFSLHARIGRDWYLKDFANPQVLAYCTTYQTVCADLKELTGSA
jgi:hypothetical protein